MLYLFCFKKKYIHRNKITTKSIAAIKAPRNPEFSNTSPRIFTTAQSPKHQPITLRWFVPCAESTNHLKPRLGYGHRHLLPKNVRREMIDIIQTTSHPTSSLNIEITHFNTGSKNQH